MMDGVTFKHNDYYTFALVSWGEWLSTQSELTERYGIDRLDIKGVFDLAQADWKRFQELSIKQSMASTSYVLYCALYLESYINFYGVTNNIPNIRDYESSLSIKNKWRIYPRIVTGKQISGAAIKILGVIFSKRDDIVHFKPQTNKAKHQILLVKDGIELINGAHFVRKELAEIDPNAPWNGKDLVIPDGVKEIQLDVVHLYTGKQ